MPAPMMTIERPLVFSAFCANSRASEIACCAGTPVIDACQAGGVGNVVVIVLGAGAAETAIDAVVRAQKIEHRGNQGFAVDEVHAPDRHIAHKHVAALIVFRETRVRPSAEIRKSHGYGVIATIDQAERERDLGAALPIPWFEVPAPLGLACAGP